MNQGKRNIIFICILFFVIVSLSACSSSSGVPNDNTGGDEENLVWSSHSGNDFSFDYPSEWNLNRNHEALVEFESLYSDMYSSGMVAEPENNDSKLFLTMALDVEAYFEAPLTDRDLEDFAIGFNDSYIASSEDNPELIEEARLTVDGNSAIRLTYNISQDRASFVITYKGYYYYFIGYGSHKDNYNDMLSLYTEMMDSLTLH